MMYEVEEEEEEEEVVTPTGEKKQGQPQTNLWSIFLLEQEAVPFVRMFPDSQTEDMERFLVEPVGELL